MGSLRSFVMKDKEEELTLFLEMRKRERERNDLLLLHNSHEFDAPLGAKRGSSPIFDFASATPMRMTGADDFLSADNDKNDYDWLLTPPGTPLFPSLETESQKTVMTQLGTPKARPTALKSRLTNPRLEPASRSNIASRQLASSPVSNTSSSGLRRPSSSGGSRPSTPTRRPTLSTSKSTLTASRPSSTTASKAMTCTATSKTMSTTSVSRQSRPATPTSRATLASAKATAPPRSSSPTARSSARSSSARSSTPTTRVSTPGSKSVSRVSTPTRRPSSATSTANTNATLVKSSAKSATSTARNPSVLRHSSPTVKPRPWKPSDIPGFSPDAPPNLRTSLPDRPISATRGRPGAPSVRSLSVEPASNGKIRRQSCSPARGRPPNGVIHSSGSSVPIPAMSRLHAKANDNVSPVVVGNKMVERVINMRKLVPPKQDDKQSPRSNLSTKSSSPDSSGFGRTLSKKSLDMAIRHMDIRRSIPGNLRALMTNIPASSMYSVRSGPNRSRTVSVSDSPLATSSNASSEVSVNNNAICADGIEADDDINSNKGARSPASVHGR